MQLSSFDEYEETHSTGAKISSDIINLKESISKASDNMSRLNIQNTYDP
jgi:hypothetical protein